MGLLGAYPSGVIERFSNRAVNVQTTYVGNLLDFVEAVRNNVTCL